MDSLERRINEISGYLELGMVEEALEEIQGLEKELSGVQRAQFLALRLKICRQTERWGDMRDAAETLRRMVPQEPEVWINEADAVRHAESLEAATRILQQAEKRFPDNDHIKFQLACYHTQLQHLEEGERYVREAALINERWKKIAMSDTDMEPLWNQLDFGEPKLN